jgi:hypothetical protein
MSSRARMVAAVTLLSSSFAGSAAWAQATNLEAGKSASQLFASTCSACHKSPRGLLKTVSPPSLPDFLREHYTTGGEMASQLSAYLIANGAGDGKQAKHGADKQGASSDQPERQGRKNTNTPARPDDAPPVEGERQGRRRQATPGQTPEEGKPMAATEHGPDGRKLSAKQRNRLGKPPGPDEPSMANEPPKAEPKTEPAAGESGPDDKTNSEAREVTGNAGAKPDVAGKAVDEPKSGPAKPEAAKIDASNPATDRPAVGVPAIAAPSVAAGSASEPAGPQANVPAPSEPQAVTASVPPPAPAGPPAPPMSQ